MRRTPAQQLGRLGGKANTPAQAAARARALNRSGRATERARWLAFAGERAAAWELELREAARGKWALNWVRGLEVGAERPPRYWRWLRETAAKTVARG